eukprot:3356891-Rhodomonas_salina.2
MSGTDMPYAAVCLCPSYAMSGTDMGYAATRSEHKAQLYPMLQEATLVQLPTYVLRARYAVSRTTVKLPSRCAAAMKGGRRKADMGCMLR